MTDAPSYYNHIMTAVNVVVCLSAATLAACAVLGTRTVLRIEKQATEITIRAANAITRASQSMMDFADGLR